MAKMVKVTIEIDDELLKKVKSRAKKNYFDTREQVEDIIRRSMLNWRNTSKNMNDKIDDKLVSIFSKRKKARNKIGRKKKKS